MDGVTHACTWLHGTVCVDKSMAQCRETGALVEEEACVGVESTLA